MFVDGLGLGPADPAVNPVADASLGRLGPVLAAPEGPPATGLVRAVGWDGATGYLTSADAGLGVPGPPQSATGQTALLTGLNAPAYVGRHVNAYPTGRLRELLERNNLLAGGTRAGRRVTFLNMFRPDTVGPVSRGERRAAAFTLAALSAGTRLRSVDEFHAGQAVFHDVTGWTLEGQDYGIPLITPEEAAERAWRVADRHHLTVFEHFLTDLAGHSREPAFCLKVLGNLERFLGALIARLDPGRNTLVLASDHGNIEDLSRDGHTLLPVPVLAFGRRARETVAGVEDITRVAARLADLAGIPAWIGTSR